MPLCHCGLDTFGPSFGPFVGPSVGPSVGASALLGLFVVIGFPFLSIYLDPDFLYLYINDTKRP